MKPSSERTWRVLSLLADGEFHSGEIIAAQLGVSRASVFNALADAADFGVDLQRIRGHGYRLAHPWQRLDRDQIADRLGADAGRFDIEIMAQVPSTNTLLLQQAAHPAGAANGKVLAAEFQTAGRGRMGRSWHAGLGSSLTFSLLWRFDCGLNALTGLSLAAGIAIVRALNGLGAQGVRLKWPNDILTAQGKLGGVLIEAQGDMLGPSAVVIGIGLNCTLPARLLPRIGQPAAALDEICNTMPDRNLLLAALLQQLAIVLERFGKDGFAPFRGEWEQYNIHRDRTVQLLLPDDSLVSGTVRGVSDSGALCVETAQGLRQFNSGEVRGPRCNF
jgi:BirA family biotin operon repressor/biotin-[acetyl-CoA-carboxylase] ligase